MENVVPFSEVRDRVNTGKSPRPRVGNDLYIAFRLRYLLSGHNRTWVYVESIERPEPRDGWYTEAKRIRVRLEDYVGQAKTGTISGTLKSRLRNARDSAIVIDMEIDRSGMWPLNVTVNDIRLLTPRGWKMYRIRTIMMGVAREIEAIGCIMYEQPSGIPMWQEDTIPSGVNRIQQEEGDGFSYIREKGRYPWTHNITRRGDSGQIHGSETTDRRHSAYPGW